MADDLLIRSIQVGANIGNMAAQRQERMMQLRSQAALNAIHERELAAQADMISQHAALYKQQLLKNQDDELTDKATTAAMADHYDFLTNEQGYDTASAAQTAATAAVMSNPRIGKQLQGFLGVAERQQASKDRLAGVEDTNDTRVKNAAANNATRKAIADDNNAVKQGVAAANIASREKIASGKLANGAGTDVIWRRAVALQSARDAVESAQQGGDPEELERAQHFLQDMEQGVAAQHPDPADKVKAQALNTEYSKALGAYYQDTANPQLKADVERIHDEIANLGRGGKGASKGGGVATPGKQRFRLENGRLVPIK